MSAILYIVFLNFLLPVFFSDSYSFAQHSTFLYLIYDVLRRRDAALANSVTVKRKDWKSAQAAISSLTFGRLASAAKSVLDQCSQ